MFVKQLQAGFTVRFNNPTPEISASIKNRLDVDPSQIKISKSSLTAVGLSKETVQSIKQSLPVETINVTKP